MFGSILDSLRFLLSRGVDNETDESSSDADDDIRGDMMYVLDLACFGAYGLGLTPWRVAYFDLDLWPPWRTKGQYVKKWQTMFRD